MIVSKQEVNRRQAKEKLTGAVAKKGVCSLATRIVIRHVSLKFGSVKFTFLLLNQSVTYGVYLLSLE